MLRKSGVQILYLAPLSLCITSCKSVRGKVPIGITYRNGKYEVRVNDYICRNQRIDLGHFDNVEDAFNSYKVEKEKIIKNVADKYKLYIPNKL